MEQKTITTEKGTRINVDAYENWETKDAPDNIWLNIAVPMASASVVLTKDQAKELAAVLLAFAEAA